MTTTNTARIGSLCALLGAAAYSSFLLAPLAHSRLPVASSYPSELEATGQPWQAFFRGTDVLSGLLIVVVAVALYQTSGGGRLEAWMSGLLAVTGLASVADGATTMGCAPSLNPACAAKDATVPGLLSQTFESHTLSGLAGFLAVAAAMVVGGYTLRRPARPHGRPIFGPWGAASAYCGFALWGVGLIDAALLAADRWFGVTERARALLVSVWLLGAAAYLLVLSRRDVATVGQRAAAGSSESAAVGHRHGSAPSSFNSRT